MLPDHTLPESRRQKVGVYISDIVWHKRASRVVLYLDRTDSSNYGSKNIVRSGDTFSNIYRDTFESINSVHRNQVPVCTVFHQDQL